MRAPRLAGSRWTARIRSLASSAAKISDSPVEERYMGGEFCARDYSRSAPAPQKLFD